MTFPTQDVADKLGIPRIVLFPCCAARLLFIHYVARKDPFTIETGTVPYEQISTSLVIDAITSKERREEVFCDGIPGLPRLLGKDLPHFKHTIDETHSLWEFQIESWKACNSRAYAIVMNTFKELEPSTCSLLSEVCDVPVYDVGFWIDLLHGESSTSIWKEDDRCMEWLDQQPASSVLYISFGSTTILSKPQFEALLHGVIASQHRFLWVLRPGIVAFDQNGSSLLKLIALIDGMQ
ncbi:hypothetical protein KP509_30G049900 [Ceratopteris richardii]|uniref:Uncharacterized protein n=1 Tax=Ceratopteris richardii TaxID=49495 RepID=A0A8T2R3V4_CERRI|nr:hypothetical protein KP509_30G049900 [Ceratopteris richardii]